ncbi:hypothetical protein NL676_025430 [Syzygium grande]|nr:hypothetical protein NL676_025430 [Syzygium grande]
MKEVHRLLLVAVAWWLRQGGAPTVAGDCTHACGGVTVPYPFGLEPQCVAGDCTHACGGVTVPYPFGLEPQCARSIEFLLNCTTTNGSHAQLLLKNIPIRKISVGDSTMVVSLPELYDCYNVSGHPANTSDDLVINLSSYPQYRLSDTRNNLIVLGCDSYSLISDEDGMVRSGCISYCSEQVDFAKETTCSGHGCCQASIPKGLKTLRISLSSIDRHVPDTPSSKDLGKRADLVLDWMVGWDVMTCEQATLNLSSYTCGNNAYCHDFANGTGYRCFWVRGNPYDRIHGCQGLLRRRQNCSQRFIKRDEVMVRGGGGVAISHLSTNLDEETTRPWLDGGGDGDAMVTMTVTLVAWLGLGGGGADGEFSGSDRGRERFLII